MNSKIFIFFYLLFPLSALAQNNNSGKKISNDREILVQINTQTSPEKIIQDLNKEYGAEFIIAKKIAPRFGIYNLKKINIGKLFHPIIILRNHPDIISAQYDMPVEFRDSIPNDPLYVDQWDLPHLGLPSIWDISTGGTTANGDEIVVAVIDSGFDITHPDLQGNLWVNQKEAQGVTGQDDDGNGLIDDIHGWNFVNNSNDLLPAQVNSHGTSVSGIIGAKGNNGIGGTGVNWDVKMMLVTVKNVSEIVAGFNYALEQREKYNDTNGAEGAFVVVTNGSFGIDGAFCDSQPAWAAMYDLLGEQGVLSVAATANENWNVEELGDMPTTCTTEYLIGVTATDREDNKLGDVAFGDISIDLGAPGFESTTPGLNGTYNPAFGKTSAACPHVSGTVALLYSMPCADLADLAMSDPPAAALLMRKAILENTFPSASLRGKSVTGGRLDAYESMKHIHSWCIGTPEDRSNDPVKEVYLGRRGLVRVFPNPSTDQVTVDFAALEFGKEVTFRVFNSIGQEMLVPMEGVAFPFEKQQIILDVTDWSRGVYVINILDNSQKLSLPFVKM